MTNNNTNVYGARDVANAPDIKKAIQRRSEKREDTAEISEWLVKHFSRYLIGNSESDAVINIQNVAHAHALYGNNKVQPWLIKKLNERMPLQEIDDTPETEITSANASSTLDNAGNDNTQAQQSQKKQPHTNTNAVWWIDVHHDSILAEEKKLLEFLKTRKGTSLEGKLMRVNCLQALALSQTEHDNFKKLQNMGWQRHHDDAVTCVLRHKQGSFFEFVPQSQHFRAEMAYESQFMQHCLGQFEDKKHLKGGYGEYYAEECEQGRMRLFSFRTHNQQPRITISVELKKQGLVIEQIKGKQNKAPVAKYHQAVLDFLNHLSFSDTDTNDDVLAMGIVRLANTWQHISQITQEDDQLYLMQHHPNLLHNMNFTSPLLQWLALVHAPKALAKQLPHPSLLSVLGEQHATGALANNIQNAATTGVL